MIAQGIRSKLSASDLPTYYFRRYLLRYRKNISTLTKASEVTEAVPLDTSKCGTQNSMHVAGTVATSRLRSFMTSSQRNVSRRIIPSLTTMADIHNCLTANEIMSLGKN